MYGSDCYGSDCYGAAGGAPSLAGTLVFIGVLAAGATAIIDFARKTITVAGVNVLKNVSGTFFNLPPGANTVTYKDLESSRTLNVKIKHKDKWL